MFNWQLAIVLLVVAAAAVYVGRVLWKSITANSGGSCGSCNSCGTSDEMQPKAKSLVMLDEGPADSRNVGP